MKLPPVSSTPRAELVTILADIARRVLGGMHPDDAREVEDWIEKVEARLTDRSPPQTKINTGAGVLDRCSRCGRPGHKRTTCSEPDVLERMLRETIVIEPPETKE